MEVDKSGKRSGKSDGNTIHKRSMKGNKITGEKCPDDRSDVTGEETGNRPEKVTVHRDNKGKGSEVNGTRD